MAKLAFVFLLSAALALCSCILTDKCICCGEILQEGMIACPNCLVSVKRQAIEIKQQEEIDFDYTAED